MEINAQTLGAGDASSVPNSTPFIDQAVQQVYGAGGGEVILPAVPNGYNLDRRTTGTYAQKGGGIQLRKGVSLRGEGTKLLLRDNCDFITLASPKNTPYPTITITGDVHYGDTVLQVDSTSALARGARVFLKVGNSGFETAEPRYFGFAAVASVPDATHVALDRPVLADMTAASTTTNCRSLWRLDEVVEGIRIDGFDLINDMQGGANAEAGVDLFLGRHIEVSRISGLNPGAALVGAQFCDQISAKHLDCRGSARQKGQLSKGRVLGFSGSTNVEVDGVSGANFEGAFVFTEFFCENIKLRTVAISNTLAGRDNAHTALIFNQVSSVDFDGLRISGYGSYVTDDGGVGNTWKLPATTRVHNLTAHTNPVLNWPASVPVDGYRTMG